MFDQYQGGRKPASGGQSLGPQQIWSPDFASGLKVVPNNCIQGTWTNATTTFAAVASGFFNLFTASNGDGVLIGSSFKFSAVNLLFAVGGGGSTSAYEYWNGAWTALTGTNLTSTPTFTVGYNQLRFTIPADWIPGGSGTAVPQGTYNVRIRATTSTYAAPLPNGRCSLATALDVSLTEALASDVSALSTWKAYSRNFPNTLTVNASQVGGVNGIVSALGVSTWYYLYLISNGYQWGLWLDTSGTAPSLPGDSRFKILLGVYRTDANSVLLPWYQQGSRVIYPTAVTDLNGGAASTWTAVPLTIPLIAISVRFGMLTSSGANSTGARISAEPGDISANSLLNYVSAGGATSLTLSVQEEFDIKIAQTIYYVVSAGTLNLSTWGYRMPGLLS